MNYLQAQFGSDLCMLEQLGWINASNVVTANEAVITADIASLPPSVAVQLGLDTVSQCAANLLQDALQEPTMRRCVPTYTAAQQAAVQSYGAAVFSFECFQHLLGTACYDFVEQVYVAPYRNIYLA